MQTGFLKGLVLACLLPLAALANEAGKPLSLWQVDGDRNRVYLLGSIHMLRAEDHPLPGAIYAAYDDAEKLVMELDMDDLDPVESQALSNELGLIQDGRTLSDYMGETLYAEAESLAVAAQIPLGLLANAEPWFAAMNVEIMLLMRMGFNPALGVESNLLERAQADDKEIVGFETIRQQLEFLDGLSAEAQQEMLIQALADGVDMRELMDGMIDAWREGDIAYLEENLLADMQSYPELNQTIVIDRNLRWTDEIETMLDDDIDYLVVVGTLHLVGEDGVPELLASRGHDVVQVHQSAD
jgi:uncharacterized protein YbaP (TraB family)